MIGSTEITEENTILNFSGVRMNPVNNIARLTVLSIYTAAITIMKRKSPRSYPITY